MKGRVVGVVVDIEGGIARGQSGKHIHLELSVPCTAGGHLRSRLERNFFGFVHRHEGNIIFKASAAGGVARVRQVVALQSGPRSPAGGAVDAKLSSGNSARLERCRATIQVAEVLAPVPIEERSFGLPISTLCFDVPIPGILDARREDSDLAGFELEAVEKSCFVAIGKDQGEALASVGIGGIANLQLTKPHELSV